jgi:hypothetical protein
MLLNKNALMTKQLKVVLDITVPVFIITKDSFDFETGLTEYCKCGRNKRKGLRKIEG